MVGTRGVPARYGGFETCVEEVGSGLAAAGHDVVVYCRTTAAAPHVSSTPGRPAAYRGMRLVHLPAVRRRSWETLSHTAASVAHLTAHPVDAVVLFNAANAPLLPALRARGLPVATHVDGLEWQRAKWSGVGRRYYRIAEALAVRWSDALIADAPGIRTYYQHEFGAQTELISYGAPLISSRQPARLAEVGLEPRGYHLVVARFEPENHVGVIVDGYSASQARCPLVVVGSAPYSDRYTASIEAHADARVRFLGSVWDQALLDELYANALTYQHGHSVGGTNPSLLRAIGAGAPTDAFSVSFNHDVLGSAGRYWSTAADVAWLVESAEADRTATLRRGRAAQERAAAYRWDVVVQEYEQLCAQLASRQAVSPRASGRRRAVPERRRTAA
jgi:glycosyltransferase involved in cell wall biosynthesis